MSVTGEDSAEPDEQAPPPESAPRAMRPGQVVPPSDESIATLAEAKDICLRVPRFDGTIVELENAEVWPQTRFYRPDPASPRVYHDGGVFRADGRPCIEAVNAFSGMIHYPERPALGVAPKRLALMHGPGFEGDGAAALRALAEDHDRRIMAAVAAPAIAHGKPRGGSTIHARPAAIGAQPYDAGGILGRLIGLAVDGLGGALDQDRAAHVAVPGGEAEHRLAVIGAKDHDIAGTAADAQALLGLLLADAHGLGAGDADGDPAAALIARLGAGGARRRQAQHGDAGGGEPQHQPFSTVMSGASGFFIPTMW